MFKSSGGLVFLLVVLTCTFSPAHAELPQVQNGLDYLNSSQNADGNWDGGSSSVETTAATVSALETMKLVSYTGSTSYAKCMSWLQAQSPNSVGYIAERVRVLNPVDGSVNALIAALDPLRGAWGGGDGYVTDILDTALALQALKAVSYTNVATINTALAYLTTTQNTDGGWGFSTGDDSNVYMTAVVSTTLQQFPQMATIAAATNKATTYLLAHQNADGGFGDSPSTAYETALAYSALAGNGRGRGDVGNVW